MLHYRGLIHGFVTPRYWNLGDGDYAVEIAFVRGELPRLDKPHWREFLPAWGG